MLCGGIHELQSAEGITHLRDALSLGLSDEEARKNIRVLLMGKKKNEEKKDSRKKEENLGGSPLVC